MKKLLRTFYRSGQRSGHQRSPKVKFGLFQHFSTNWRITRDLEELQCCAKAHSIALLTFFRYCVLRFDQDQRFGLQGAKTTKRSVYCDTRFSAITFDSVKTQYFCCHHRVSLVKPRRMIYNLTLKGHVESLTSGQGHDLTRKGHVAYQSIRIVDLNTSMVFSSL